MSRLTSVWRWVLQTRAYRAAMRFFLCRGSLLAAGIAYFAFFSVFPALTLALSVFGFVLQDNPDLYQSLLDELATLLPGLITTSSTGAAMITTGAGSVEISPPSSTALTITGLVSLATLALAGMGWLGALRSGIREMFGVRGNPGNVVTARLRDFGVLVMLGLALLVSTVATTGVATAATEAARVIGFGDGTRLVTTAGVLVGATVDIATVMLLLRVLSGVALPWKDIRQGALVGGLSLTVVKYFGGQLIALGVRNPVFGALIGVVGLLFWLNLLGSVILYAAAWAANLGGAVLATPSGASSEATQAGQTAGPQTEARHTQSSGESGLPLDPAARVAVGAPTLGPRSVDRVTLAAGAVLGATAVAGVSVLGRAWRAGRRP